MILAYAGGCFIARDAPIVILVFHLAVAMEDRPLEYSALPLPQKLGVQVLEARHAIAHVASIFLQIHGHLRIPGTTMCPMLAANHQPCAVFHRG